MIVLWIAAALLASGAAGLMLHRASGAARAGAPIDPTLGVYQRQLAEIDDLAARDLIAPQERRAAHAEAARRLLAAADTQPPAQAQTASPRTLLLLAAAAPLLAVVLYLAVGAPGDPDQPFATRLTEWKAHPQRHSPPELAAALRSLAAEHPRDPEPWRRLAQLQLSMSDADGAIDALRRAVAIAPGRADLLAPLGEIMTLKAQGKVDAEAEAVFRQLLAADPASPVARYYLARASIARGDATGGLAMWRALLNDLPAQDPRRPDLAGDIAAVASTGQLPPTAPSEPAPDQARAIQGMVDGLAARLKARPDDPPGWVRLVRAYTVLGETDRRDAALAEARRRHAGRPDILAQLASAATPVR